MSYTDILVSNLNPNTGAIFNSQTPLDSFGYSVNAAGDFNGDGYKDILVCSLFAQGYTGAVYVIFGSKDGFSDLTVSSSLSSNQGIVINGENTWDMFGASLSSARDVNGDEIDDIVIGAFAAQVVKGRAYIIYGSKAPPAVINLASGLSASQGFMVTTNNQESLGSSVSWAGDFNKDGVDDVIIGGLNYAGGNGAAYVIFGKKGTRGNINLSSGLAANEGFAIFGSANGNLGVGVSFGGDVNGDGITDVIVGALGDNSVGAAYILFGKKSNAFATIHVSSGLSQSQGFVIRGSVPGDQFGVKVGSAGDFNGDGANDVIIAAVGSTLGEVYVIFGSKNPSDITLSSGFNGVKIIGAEAFDEFGTSVNFAVNGDGIGDIVAGAPQGNSLSGIAYVIFGRKTFVGGSEIDLSNGLGPTEGFSIKGASPNDFLGVSACSAGDLNNDGMDDIIVSTNTADGKVYLIFSPLVCPEKCMTCETRSVCLSCKPDFGMENKMCVDCPLSTELINGICEERKSSLVITTKVSKGLFDSGSLASRIFTLGRSLSVSLGLIAKIIQNVRYLNISYPADALNAFENYGTDLFELPIPEVFYESPETKVLPSQYSRYDISPTFMENYWQTIMTALISLMCYLVIRLIQYFTKKQKNKESMHQVALKNIGQTMANFVIIQIYSSLDDVVFFFLLDVGSTKLSSPSAGVSLGMAIIFVLLGAFFVLLHCWVLGKYQQAKQKDLLENFEKKFSIVGTLFEDFKDDSTVKQSFFGILILRCVFLVLVITLLQPPWIQASLLMVANLFFLAFVIYQRPFKNRLDEISQYFCELNVFAAYLSVLILSILDFQEKEAPSLRGSLGKCIVLAGIVLCLGGFILQMIQTIFAIIEIIKFFKNYYCRKTQVTPASDEVNQDSESSNIMKNSGIDLVELIHHSHRKKIAPLALEKFQFSGNIGMEVSFANNENPPVMNKTSKNTRIGEFEALRTQGSSHYFTGQTNQFVLNLESEILPSQMNLKRKKKKFKKKERQPN